MKILASVLLVLLGIVMCLIADYETQYAWSGDGIHPPSWNLFGSVVIGGGLTAFVIEFFWGE